MSGRFLGGSFRLAVEVVAVVDVDAVEKLFSLFDVEEDVEADDEVRLKTSSLSSSSSSPTEDGVSQAP